MTPHKHRFQTEWNQMKSSERFGDVVKCDRGGEGGLREEVLGGGSDHQNQNERSLICICHSLSGRRRERKKEGMKKDGKKEEKPGGGE